LKYARAAGSGTVWALVALPVSFALIDLGLSLWILVLYRVPMASALTVAWQWAAKVWGAYAVSFATVGFFFGWVKSLRHT
jgi:hypothetical protein